MKFIGKIFSSIVLIAAVGFAGYVYVTKPGPCEVPIRYSLGAYDPRFNISKEDFVAAAEEATHVWEKALGRDFFTYAGPATTPTRFELYFTRPPVVVGLHYDERQQIASQRQELLSQISETRGDAREVRAQFEALQARYATSRAEYLSLLDAYKKRRGDHNTLEAKRLEVNALADEINALVKKYNYLVSAVNSRIDTINQNAGYEFEEGQYKSDENGETITIYEFGNRTTLVRVLAHEFGHALGLDHNDNERSIMYYLNNNQNLTPTKEDIAAVKAVCEMK